MLARCSIFAENSTIIIIIFKPLFYRDAQGNTALHIAILHKRSRNVSALLRMGADASLPNVYGCTPLILSAQFGYEEIAKILLYRDPGTLKNTEHRS